LYFYDMRPSLPIYSIKDFRDFSEEHFFYSNHLMLHVKFYDFTNKPHKHDFFLVVLFTSGSGTHEVDFQSYPVKPGALFLLRPGQMHNWNLSKDSDGYLFFHTRHFYDEGYTLEKINNYPFYSSLHNPRMILLKNKSYLKIRELLKEINEEYQKNELLKFQKLHTLVNLVYIETSRLYKPSAKMGTENYLLKVRHFEDLIDKNFKEIKTAGEYAAKMHMSEKHLNRISKTCLDKTSTGLISERIVLEAKRLLMQSRLVTM
jgi:AraC family transcriptional activator of pobA